MSRRGSESLRGRCSTALLAVFIALAPRSVPSWRLDPVRRVAAVLAVGEPTPALMARHPGLTFPAEHG